MFGFLKKKLKSAVSVFSKKVEEEVAEEEDLVEEDAPEEEQQEDQEESEEEQEEDADDEPEDDEPEEEEPVEGPEEEEEPDEEPDDEEPAEESEEEEPEEVADDSQEEVTEGQEEQEESPQEQEEISEEDTEESSDEAEDEAQEEVQEDAQETEVKEEESTPEEPAEETPEEVSQDEDTEEDTDGEKETPEEPKKGFFARLKEKVSGKKDDAEEEKQPKEEAEEVKEDSPPVQKEEKKEKKQKTKPKVEEKKEASAKEEKPAEKKKGFFGKIGDAISKKTVTEDKFEELFWEIEVALLEGNVALSVIEKIKEDLKNQLVDQKVNRFEIQKIVMGTVQSSVREILTFDPVDLVGKIKEKNTAGEPFIVCVVGVNGTGKTTSIAKLIHYLKKRDLNCTVAAGDTFRAAALEQLQTHADNLDIKLIKHDYGSDAAAVAFDAIKYAKQKDVQVVLIDTAGRLHSNTNLMEELKKVLRVSNADFTLFVGDSLTGNDAVEQAEKYNELVGIDGIILSKADVDEKGGATISTSYVVQKPILFLGTGQEYEDFEEFNVDKMMEKLGLA